MNNIKNSLILVVFSIVFLSCSTMTKKNYPPIRTFKTDFINYWKEAKLIPEEKISHHREIYKKHFLNEKNRQFTLDVVFAKGKKIDEDKLNDRIEKALKKYLPVYRKSYPEIIKNFNSFEAEITVQLDKFTQKVPDFKYRDLPIYGIISLGYTLGGLREHKGKSILTFGIDQFVEFGNVRMSILFSHEAFHAYHQQVNPNIDNEVKEDEYLLLTGAYFEGLATYASGYLNPETSRYKHISAERMRFCNSDRWKSLIRPFLEDSKKLSYKKSLKDNTLYAKWFHLGTKIGKDYPGDVGYCLGDKILTEIAKKHSLATIARWNLSEVQKEMFETLKKFR